MKKIQFSKTTVGGFLIAIGTGIQNVPNPVIAWIGQGLIVFGSLMLGKAAQDAE